MIKIKHISIIVSFFCLWLTSFLNIQHEIVLGFLLILSFGILHGSNDIYLISKVKSSRTASYVRVLVFYILFVLIGLILFYFLPLLALAIFIISSAYHFGEQHWEIDNLKATKFWKQSFYTLYGTFLLSLLFKLNSVEVIAVITAISGYTLSSSVIIYAFYINLFFLLLVTIYFIVKDENFRKQILVELLYTLVLFIIFKNSSLIWGFAIYFVLWHSLPSLYDQIEFLYKKVDKNSILKYIRKALPYWLISVLGIIGLYFFFRDLDIFYALFFSFLAAVTFPHSIAITRMFKKNKQ